MVGIVTPRNWSPQASLVGVGWALAAAAAVWTVLTDDNGGRLLGGVATIVLVLLALYGTVARPRLRADEEGLTVRGLFGSRNWPWPQVRFRVDHHRRLGRTSSMLEITVLPDEQLIVLGRLDLGADPEDVVEELTALRP
jgi:Bacterial PH domain